MGNSPDKLKNKIGRKSTTGGLKRSTGLRNADIKGLNMNRSNTRLSELSKSLYKYHRD